MSNIQLKHVNPESETEAKTLYEQRVLCGWNSDLIDLWRQQIRDGDRVRLPSLVKERHIDDLIQLMWWIMLDGIAEPIGHIGLFVSLPLC